MVSYEFKPDLKIIKRKVYGFLDFLGDIGGLSGGLKTSFFLLMFVFDFKHVINYIGNRIFLIRSGDEKEPD